MYERVCVRKSKAARGGLMGGKPGAVHPGSRGLAALHHWTAQLLLEACRPLYQLEERPFLTLQLWTHVCPGEPPSPMAALRQHESPPWRSPPWRELPQELIMPAIRKTGKVTGSQLSFLEDRQEKFVMTRWNSKLADQQPSSD